MCTVISACNVTVIHVKCKHKAIVKYCNVIVYFTFIITDTTYSKAAVLYCAQPYNLPIKTLKCESGLSSCVLTDTPG